MPAGSGMSRWVPLCTAEWYGDGAETLEAKTVRQYRIWQTDEDIPEDERESTTCATRLRARDHATGEVREINYYVHIARGKKAEQAEMRALINAEARLRGGDDAPPIQSTVPPRRRGFFLNSSLHC